MSDIGNGIRYGIAMNEYSATMTIETKHGFEESITLLKAEIEKAGLWIIGEIDPEKLAARAELKIHPARQILFFHPEYLKKLLEINPDALIEIPLKATVIQKENGAVVIRLSDIDRALSTYPELEKLKNDLVEIIDSIKTEIRK